MPSLVLTFHTACCSGSELQIKRKKSIFLAFAFLVGIYFLERNLLVCKCQKKSCTTGTVDVMKSLSGCSVIYLFLHKIFPDKLACRFKWLGFLKMQIAGSIACNLLHQRFKKIICKCFGQALKIRLLSFHKHHYLL